SPFYGASLAAIAIGMAPGNYASTPEIQERAKLLRDYLRKGSDSQHLFNRLTLLWASALWPGLLTPEQQRAIVDTARRAQQDDGGWSVATFAQWKRIDSTQLDTRSDGYGTGLVTFVLQTAGVPRTDPQVRRGLDWLVKHHDTPTGMWFAASPNKQRDPASDPGKFMSDAATAYAVLALTREARGRRALREAHSQRAWRLRLQRAGSLRPQRAGSLRPQRAGSLRPQRAGSLRPQRAGSLRPQSARTLIACIVLGVA